MSNKHVVLVGAGIMSASLGMLIKRLEPEWNMTTLERATSVGEESSNVWNNAGTGHEALWELDYTPEEEDGSISVDKAVDIFNQFQVSKQLWANLVKDGYMTSAEDVIKPLKHMSYGQGSKNIELLSKRYQKISKMPAFEKMEYTEDADTIASWSPLMMEDRQGEEIASTKMDGGTDVNFGELTTKMMNYLQQDASVNVLYNSDVEFVKQNKHKQWDVRVKNSTE